MKTNQEMIIEVIGFNQAQKLFKAFGGKQIYIPQKKNTQNYQKLSKVLSKKALKNFWKFFRGDVIYIAKVRDIVYDKALYLAEKLKDISKKITTECVAKIKQRLNQIENLLKERVF